MSEAVQTMPPAGSHPTIVICKGCHKAFDWNGLKRCASCREKARLQRQRAALKQREKLLNVNPLVNSLNWKSDSVTNVQNKEQPSTGEELKLREMQKRLKQAVKSKEKENGSKKRNQESAGDQQSMRKRAKLFMNGLESGTSKGIQRDPAIPDFQTASHLYKALKAFKLTSPSTSNLSVCFHGGHSIVADPTIDNTRRAALVARDISKLGGLSFNHKSTISPPVSSDRSCTLSFRCTCSVVQPVGEGSASMKMTLMNSWVSGQKDPSMKGKENGTTSPQMVYCKGVIEVTAEKDSSNPYMQGQRISIRIWH